MPLSPHIPCRRDERSAFTLIETLVVIVIIATLAVLLLTAYGKLTDRASIAKSINNLRQIGIVVGDYIADHDGAFPSKRFEDTNQNWIEEVYKRAYKAEWPGFDPADTGENLRGTILFSPSLKSSESRPWRSYGWNGRLQIGGENPPRVSALSRPSQVILCGDSRNSSNIDYKNVNYRNNGKALMLMADFHVQMFAPEEIPANLTDPMWRPAY